MYTVYVLKSTVIKKSYVGITNDLERRLREHNEGKSYFTKRYLPWIVVYKEQVQDREEARKREKYLKSAAGRRFLKKEVFNN
jgi:putative endonuclease